MGNWDIDEKNKQMIKDAKEEMKIKSEDIKFESLSDAKKKRGLKILSYGNFSSGKTHFALSSPKPIFIIDTENGASPLADKFPDAQILNISSTDNNNIEEKDEVRNFEKFQKAVEYISSLPDNEIGTVIVDSMSDIWEWAQAYGKVKVFKIEIEDRLKQQWDWGVINKLYLKQLKKLIDKKCNVILTSREREVYIGAGKPSGIYEAHCQKKTPYWVDIVLRHYVTMDKGKIAFQAKIEKCRHKGEVMGKVIRSPTIEKIKELLNEK